jgi:hypothetical protein
MLQERFVNQSARSALLTMMALFLLSAATLTFEINLSRLFAVAQFYHFAFMTVSIALLGFGASGTVLAILPRLVQKQPEVLLGWLSLASGLSMLAAYLLTNLIPFDSFSLAWDRRQALILIIHYVALSTPFFFTGMAVGALLAARPRSGGKTYAVNLFGSAVGCLLALVAPQQLSGEGTVVLSSGLAALAAVLCQFSGNSPEKNIFSLRFILATGLLALCLFDCGWRASGKPSLPWLELRLSPYKGLSYSLQYPQSRVIFRRWNAFSRVDLVHSAGIHSYPGLSYRYLKPLPAQDGLLIDGDDLSPVLQPGVDMEFASYLPSAAAYQLKPQADVLILEPRGGLDIAAALALGAKDVTAVEVNPRVVQAAQHIYNQPKVHAVIESDRSYLRGSQKYFDLIILSLTSSYHPVRSGAYSLAEDYRYTVEAFQDGLAHLRPEGMLVLTRWLQMPPSECLRTFALAVSALERSGGDPRQQIVAIRGYNTATFFIKKTPFIAEELRQLRAFAAQRAFDLIYAPDIQPQEVNQFNILAEPVYYQAFRDLLNTQPRHLFYERYAYDVTPPSDDRPFMGHYFKWSQARQVLAEVGKTWQPFGGAGYFVLLTLLGVAVLLAGFLILLPVAIVRIRSDTPNKVGPANRIPTLASLTYFGLIGLAYLLVEIPLIQRFILYLGQPAYAMTMVLFTLLLFSGIGSALSSRIPIWLALGVLCVLLFSFPALLPAIFNRTLGTSLPMRIGLSILILAPLGLCMGMPLPAGIHWIGKQTDQGGSGNIPLIPWVWAVNGTASVVAAVLAALLALTFGHGLVFLAGACCYLGSWIMAVVMGHLRPAARLHL